MLRRDRALAGDLKTQPASPQWQRSRAAEQAAETESKRKEERFWLEKNKRSADADLGTGSATSSGEGNESSNDDGPLTLYSTSRIGYITKCNHSNHS